MLCQQAREHLYAYLLKSNRLISCSLVLLEEVSFDLGALNRLGMGQSYTSV